MLDLGWLFSMAQSAAAFVAIIAAFFTTKVLNDTTTKRGLKHRLQTLDQEIPELEKDFNDLEKEIDETSQEIADMEIRRFFDQLLKDPKLRRKLSDRDLRSKYQSNKDGALTIFERRALEKLYPEFEKQGALKRKQKHQDFELPEFIVKGPTQNLDDLKKSLRDLEYKQRRILRAIDQAFIQKQVMRDQFEEIVLPKFLSWGMVAIIYSAIAGVALPLIYALTQTPILPFWIDFLVIGMAFSSFIILPIYLFTEIRTAVKDVVIS